LNDNNLNKFIDNVEYSKINQIKKKKILSGNIEADYSITKDSTIDLHIIDKIDYTIKLFDGIKVLPTKVISQLYPFKANDNTFIDEYGLSTDNEELFNFMDSLHLENGRIEINSKEKFVEDQDEKLEKIIEFFQINQIRHIYLRGKIPKNKICVHKLYQFGKCDCERCNLDRLNFKRSKVQLNKKIGSSLYEKLRRGYTYYLYGDYKKSIYFFLNTYNEINREKNPIIYTILTYNILRLKRLVKRTYFENDSDKIIDKLDVVNFDIDEPFIKRNAPYFMDIYKSIKENRFFDEIRDDIEDCFIKIQKVYFDDKYGGKTSDNGYYRLETAFLRFTTFLDHNFIIFNQYTEFKDLSKKVLESIFMLYTLKNPDAEKYVSFDWYILDMWIFNVDLEYSKYLLRKYDIKEIKISENLIIVKLLNERIENLIISKENIKDFSDWFLPIKIDKILSKIVLIITHLDIDYNEKVKLINKIIHLSNEMDDKHMIPYKELVNFVDSNESNITKETIKSIIDLFFFDKHKRYSFGRILNIYCEKCSEIEIEELIKSILKVKKLKDISIDMNNQYLNKLFYAFTLLNNKSKKIITTKISTKLKSTFEVRLYTLATLFDLIEFDIILFDKYMNTIPDLSKENRTSFFSDNFNYELQEVINIAYKYNLEFDDKLKSLLNKVDKDDFDYFEWLMNLDNFDYSKFNSYWILRYRTQSYIKQFKNSTKLISEIQKSLKNNYNEGVAKMYFEDLIN